MALITGNRISLLLTAGKRWDLDLTPLGTKADLISNSSQSSRLYHPASGKVSGIQQCEIVSPFEVEKCSESLKPYTYDVRARQTPVSMWTPIIWEHRTGLHGPAVGQPVGVFEKEQMTRELRDHQLSIHK